MEPYVLISAASGIGGAVVGFLIFSILNRSFISWKMSRRVELSQISQEEAESLLKKRGFRIVEKQKRAYPDLR